MQPRVRSVGHRAVVVAVAAVAVVVVVGLTVVLFLRTTNTEEAAPAPPLAEAGGRQSARSGSAGVGQPTQAAPIIDETDLRRQVDGDRSAAEGLVGYWVPQLSSKQLGVRLNGVTFDYPAILADFQALRTRFPQSVLIRSDDYSSYLRPGFWVTVAAQTYASANDANAWCDTNGFAAEDCYAHRLSHTDGPAGSSKLR